MKMNNKKGWKMKGSIRFLIIIGVVAALFADSTAAHEDIDKTEENKMKPKKKYCLVDIYYDFIKKEGTFDFGTDDLRLVGLSGALAYFGLDAYVLTENEKKELWLKLRRMAEEVDSTRYFMGINQDEDDEEKEKN